MSDSPKMKPDVKGTYDAALSLLGKEVEIYIGEDPDTEEQVLVVGRLLSFGDDGTIITQDDMGFISHSWPMLNIRELKAKDSGSATAEETLKKMGKSV